MKTFKDFLEGANRAQQAAIAIAKKKSGKYDKDGKRIKEAQGPCWDGYEQKGMKKKGGKMVPNCVPEEVEIGEDKKWHYYNLDRGVYRLQKDNNGKIIGKMHDRQKEMRAGFPNADEVLSTIKQAAAKVAKLNEQVSEMRAVKQDKEIKDREGTQPAKYYAKDAEGDKMSKSTKQARDRHFAKKKKGPAPGDASAKTKPSKHTKKYDQMFGEAQIKGLKNKAEKTGISYSILKQVYDRGMAAYKSGHRPGATAQQWAFARVNSFVTKSKGTWGGADKDLAAKVRK